MALGFHTDGELSMSALAIGSIVFICVFGGALLDMFLRSILKVGIGLIATMVALVLGLLVATAKASYDTKSNELPSASASLHETHGPAADRRHARGANVLGRGPDHSQGCGRPSHYPDV
jgi:hypothetical protein